MPLLVAREEIEAVFAYWKEMMLSPRSKLDEVRRKAITERLKDGYTMADLFDAVNGCKASRFHMGENQNRKVYNDISLICRDAQHVDNFIEQWEAVKKNVEAKEAAQESAGKPVSEMTVEERAKMSANVKNILRIARA